MAVQNSAPAGDVKKGAVVRLGELRYGIQPIRRWANPDDDEDILHHAQEESLGIAGAFMLKWHASRLLGPDTGEIRTHGS